jgi:hypothetical protein
MRHIRFSTQDLSYTDPNEDCVLDPSDPIYTQVTGKPAPSHLPQIAVDDRGRIQREQNIKPGTPEWFQLWFGRKHQ